MGRLIAGALTLTLVMGGAAAPVRADDGWNPFKEREQRQRSERRQQPAPADAAALPEEPAPLPPMDGVARRPWLDDRQPPAGDLAAPSSPIPEVYRPWSDGPAGGERGAPATVTVAPSEAIQRGELQPVQRGDLKPVMAADGSGLPHDFWGGLDARQLGELLAPLTMPPASAALGELWRRLWTSNGASGNSHAGIRLEALYRSGLVDDLRLAVKDEATASGDLATRLVIARTRMAVGDRAAGCQDVKGLQREHASLPKPAKAEYLTLAALCGAGSGDAAAAGLAADLLRAEGVDAPVVLAALDAIAIGAPAGPPAKGGKPLTVIEYRFLALARSDIGAEAIASAEPALLAVLAREAADPATRVVAAEAALAVNVMSPAEVADVYRAAPVNAAAVADGGRADVDPKLRRAAVFKAIEAERTPMTRARLMRGLLDDVGRTRGGYLQTAAMLAPAAGSLRPAAELAWFAETAIEINLAGGRYDAVAAWADPPAGERHGGLRHWLALADIADPQWRGRRGEALRDVEQFAVRGRLEAGLMHRLVTVLDALDYQIPIPLWEAASRTPQPSSGHLPETGVLSQLQDAAKKKEHARTLLLALRSLGPDSGDRAHMIALGDTIRALRRAGLDGDARRLGLEAVIAGWPRAPNN